jgi:hypothetical protein
MIISIGASAGIAAIFVSFSKKESFALYRL